jgi:chorismate mutase
VAVRAIRGATQLDADEREHLLERTAELVRAVLDRNGLTSADLISVIFTATADLTSDFPAYAARRIGITDVPLLCARELDVEGAMPRVVRLLAHVETGLGRADVQHVYLHGARALRTDLRHDDPA